MSSFHLTSDSYILCADKTFPSFQETKFLGLFLSFHILTVRANVIKNKKQEMLISNFYKAPFNYFEIHSMYKY